MANYADSRIFGPVFWFTLHSSAYGLRAGDDVAALNIDEVHHIRQLHEHMCGMIPCQYCSTHCQMHHRNKPLILTTRKSYWGYLVDFHNKVNESTRKRVITSDEALELLEFTLNSTLSTVQTAPYIFKLEFWFPLIYATLHCCNRDQVMEKARAKSFLAFVESSLFLMPFGRVPVTGPQSTDTGELMRDRLLAQFKSKWTIDFVEQLTVSEAILHLTELVNFCISSIPRLGLQPIGQTDLWTAFVGIFSPRMIARIGDTERKRLEDHRTIAKLESKVKDLESQLRGKLPYPKSEGQLQDASARGRTEAPKSWTVFQVAWITVCVLLTCAVMVLIARVAYMYWRAPKHAAAALKVASEARVMGAVDPSTSRQLSMQYRP